MFLSIKEFSSKYSIPIHICYQHKDRGILPIQKIGSLCLVDISKMTEYLISLEKLEKEKSLTGGRPHQTNFIETIKSLIKPEN